MRSSTALLSLALALAAGAAHASDVSIVGLNIHELDGVHVLSVDVSNTGTSTTGGFYLDLFSERSSAPAPGAYGELYTYLPGLAPGAAQRVHFVVPPQLSGLDLYVVADTDGWLGDANPADNVVGGQPAWAPDLVFGEVVAVANGASTQVTVEVRNRGNADAGWFYVDGFVDPFITPQPGQYGSQYSAIAGLAAGETAEVDFTIAGPLGDRALHLLLDTDGWVSERSEANNHLEMQYEATCVSHFGPNLCQAASVSAAQVIALLDDLGMPTTGEQQNAVQAAVTLRMALVAPALAASMDSTASGALDAGIQVVLTGGTDEEAASRLYTAVELSVLDITAGWIDRWNLQDRLQNVNAAIVNGALVGNLAPYTDSALISGTTVADLKADLIASIATPGVGAPDTSGTRGMGLRQAWNTAKTVARVASYVLNPPTGEEVATAIVDEVSDRVYGALPDVLVDTFALTPQGQAVALFIVQVAAKAGEAWDAAMDWLYEVFIEDTGNNVGDDDDSTTAPGDDDDSTTPPGDDDDSTEPPTDDEEEPTPPAESMCLDMYTEDCSEFNGGSSGLGHPWTAMLERSRSTPNQDDDPYWNPVIDWGPDGGPAGTNGTIHPTDLGALQSRALGSIINWGPDGGVAGGFTLAPLDLLIVSPIINPPPWAL